MKFSSKIGLVMAAAGSAVGLGNIWKFPYIAGENGGGAFLIVYLICVALFGMPLLVTEFTIGKRSGKSAFGAFRALSGNNRWQWLSWACLLSSIFIMGFYFVVTGWCFSYLVESICNAFNGYDAAELTQHFKAVTSNLPRVITFSLIPVVLTAAILWFDVNKGIERVSKVLMPLLLVIMVIMAVRVLMLEGSDAGLQFFFRTDFSKITPMVVLEAMGQCFFSLSIGVGALITYGAYMPQNQNITRTSMQVILLDTMVAVMAGMIIFPAVSAFGINPAEGPELVFIVLPAIFGRMSFSWLFSVLFFSLLCIAALTSTISLMEVAVAFIREASEKTGHPLDRHKSVIIVSAAAIVLILCCIFIPRLFGDLDQLTSCFLMPLGALGMSLFVGWNLSKSINQTWYGKLYIFALRWIVPIAIIVIILNSVGCL